MFLKLSRVGAQGYCMYLPQSQVSHQDRSLLHPGIDWRHNLPPLLDSRLTNKRLSKLWSELHSSVLCSEPELGHAVLRAAVAQADILCNCKGVRGVLESHVRVHALTVVGVKESVGAEEVDFGLGAEDVGDDAGGVLVCEYFGRKPFYTDRLSEASSYTNYNPNSRAASRLVDIYFLP